MPQARVEIIILHFLVGTVNIPAIYRHSIDRDHRARAVPPACTVHVNYSIDRVADNLQKTLGSIGLRILFGAKGKLI